MNTLCFKSKNLDSLDKDLSSLNESTLGLCNVYMGFDIGKSFHYLSLLLNVGDEEKIYDLGEIVNSSEGFDNLSSIFDVLSKYGISKNRIFIGIEATGSYYFSLLKFMNTNELINTYVLNAYKVKQYKKSRTDRQKTDKEDSINIVKYLYTYRNDLEKGDDIKVQSLLGGKTKKNLIHRSKFIELTNLRYLYRQYVHLKNEESEVKSSIKELTNRIMPEIYQVFNPNKYSKMELYIKSNFTKEEVAGMKADVFYKKVMKGTKNIEWGKKSYPEKLKKLQELLKNGVGIDDDNGIFKSQMKMYCTKYRFITENIESIKELIMMELENNNLYIPKIEGIGPISVGALYSELGNHIYTKSIKELIGFTGLYPSEITSGGKMLTKPRFKNKGNNVLRRGIYMFGYSITGSNKDFNAYKNYLKVKKGIKGKEALTLTGLKVYRILLSLIKTGEEFDADSFHNYVSSLKKEISKDLKKGSKGNKGSNSSTQIDKLKKSNLNSKTENRVKDTNGVLNL